MFKSLSPWLIKSIQSNSNLQSLDSNLVLNYLNTTASTLMRWLVNWVYWASPNSYHTRSIITRSWFETALVYYPRILDPKVEEFTCLVHKLSVTLTALQYKPQWKIGKKIYKPRVIMPRVRYLLLFTAAVVEKQNKTKIVFHIQHSSWPNQWHAKDIR